MKLTLKEVSEFKTRTIEEFRAFVSDNTRKLKIEDFNIWRSDQGIIVTPQNRNWVTCEEVECIKSFCKSKSNFRFYIYSFYDDKGEIDSMRVAFEILIF